MLYSANLKSMLNDWRLSFFSVALFLYALWGAPTPDNPGLVEIAIGVALFFALCHVNLAHHIIGLIRDKKEYWQIALIIFLLYGISVPVIVALVNGASSTSIMRDMIGFAFLCLPVLLTSFMSGHQPRQRVFLFLIILIGFLFSLRVLFPDFSVFYKTAEPLYLATSPLVLFSALFLVFMSCQKLFIRLKGVNIAFFIVGMFMSLVMMAAMFVDVQRACFVALILSAIILFGIAFVKAPLRALLPLGFVACLLLVISPFAIDVLHNVQMKTSRVGVNMRFQELLAIWQVMQASPMAIIFGQGWGASFASPAVGGLHVTYSHSLLSYMFFKTGLAGLALTLFYLFFLFEKLFRLYLTDPVKGNALMWPLLIPILFYASYKSLDFGLLLTLILVSAMQKKEAAA